MEDHLLSEVSLLTAINALLDSRAAATGKALPGTIVSYDSGAKTCAVQPAVHRLVPLADDPDTDDYEVLPVLQNVPVAWPKGRNFSIEGTLTVGDPVLLICIDRDMSKWRSSGVPSEPADARQHSWASAVAIPGLIPDVPSFLPTPTNGLALSSKMDGIFRTISALTPASPAAGAAPTAAEFAVVVTALNAIIAAVISQYPGGAPAVPSLASSASSIIKVSS